VVEDETMIIASSTLVNGISASIVDFLGFLMGVLFLIKYFREKKGLMPYVSFIGFTFMGLYLGPTVTFWSLVFTNANVSFVTYDQLSYVVCPIGFASMLYLGFSIFNPDKKNLAGIIYLATAVPYYIFLFGFPDAMVVINQSCITSGLSATQCVDTLNANGQMIDISLQSGQFILNLLYIISVLIFLGGGFYYLRLKIAGIDRQRATYLAWGFSCFAIAAIIENALGSYGDVYKIIARVIMATFLLLVYKGFSAKKAPDIQAPKATG